MSNINTNESVDFSSKKRNKLIHQALMYMSINFGCYELEIKFEELASICHVTPASFAHQFHDLENLLQMSIERMEILFVRHVKNSVLISAFKGKKIIWHFLRCVRYYFNLYPEAGFLFTLSFFSNIVVSNVYRYLETYFHLWHTTIFDILKTFTLESQAKILADTYLTSLRGQLQLASIETVSASNLHAERYLASAVEYLKENKYVIRNASK